jgi:hypothetical protein
MYNAWGVVFEVLKAVSMKMAVFWVVAPCRLIRVYRRFRGLYCLHHQGDETRPDPWGRRSRVRARICLDRLVPLSLIPRARVAHGPDDGGSKNT